MESFGPERYVPVLLAKRGERRALETLDPATKDAVTPLFVVHEVDWDYDLDQPKKSLEAHLDSIPEALANCWGLPAFIDLNGLDDTLVAGNHPLTWFHEQAASFGLDLTPVVSTYSSVPYLNAAHDLVAAGSDVCLRLTVDEWPAGTGTVALDNLFASLGTDAENAHLVMDLGDDVGSAAARLATSELHTFPYLDDWRSVTLTATAIPADMPAGSALHVIARQDWRIYQAMLGLTPRLPRTPSFGDYAINGASTGIDINPAVMQIAATLRYTTAGEWLIAKNGLWKGHGGKSQGASAVPPAAALLTSHSDFLGSAHCDFDDWLETVASGVGGSNPEAWRRYGTHHHIQLTTEQVATLGGP